MSNFWAARLMYRCQVESVVIDTPEKALITSVSGSLESGKSNDDEICYYSDKHTVEYFPRGLEKIYKNLTGICFYHGPLKEIHQSDLKPYNKLIFLQIAQTQIEILEDGLFDFNPNLEYVALNGNQIFHIGLKVFDNLSKLGTLYLDGNKCISRKIKNDRSTVLDIIKDAKNQCWSSDYQDLHEKFEQLENKSLNLNSLTFPFFELKIDDIKNDLKSSNFTNSSTFNRRLQNLLHLKNEFNPQVCSKYSQIEDFEVRTNENLKTLKTSTVDSLANLDAKLKLHGEKLEQMKMDLEVTSTNILNSVNERIMDLEKHLMEKTEQILEEKLAEISKDIKKVIKML